MNRMGIGAKVSVFSPTDQLIGFSEITTGFGYASGQPAIANFGVAQHDVVSLTVEFPDGRLIRRSGVLTNRRHVVEEEL